MVAVDTRRPEFIIRNRRQGDASRAAGPAKPLQPLLVLLGLAAVSWTLVFALAGLVERLLAR